jgi:copper transport protein
VTGRTAVALGCLFGALAVIGLASPAAAHSGLSSSDPPDGALLDVAPAAVTMSFTEPPDPELSSVIALDATGAELDIGPLEQGVPPRSLTFSLPASLGDGVYTVSWRVVSQADGHLTVGAFAFGVGTDPGHVAAPDVHASAAPTISPLAVAGKTLLYAGLVVAVGAAAVGLGAFRGRVPGRRWLLRLAGVLAVGGAMAMVLAEADTIGASVDDLLASGVGRPYVWLLVTTGLTLVLGGFASRSESRVLLALTGAAAASAMLVRATSGHAAGLSPALPAELSQFAHFVAVGVWIGGLVLLLLLLRQRRAADATADEASKSMSDVETIGAFEASRRAHDAWGFPNAGGLPPAEVKAYSRMAGWALLVVVLTGILRTIGEAGGIGNVRSLLTDTTYGTTLFVKVAVALVIVALGAFNRWRSIPRLQSDGSTMRRVVTVEIAAAVGVFGLTAVLTGFNPNLPDEHAGDEPMATSISASGSDFATTTRVELTVTPGVAGPNTFEARVLDFDDGAAIAADEVTLQLAPIGHIDVEATSLPMEPHEDGMWMAEGTQLSLAGAWQAVVQVRAEARTTEVPLILVTRADPVEPSIVHQEGLPDIATFVLAGGEQLQVYLDPGTTGPNEFHVTAFDADGVELPLSSMTVVASMHEGEPEVLDATQLTPGHFSSSIDVEAGLWRFEVVAGTEQGGVLQATYEFEVTG